jgi:nucleoid DNA-binding protein
VQVLDGEGVANRTGLESCVVRREACSEALTEAQKMRLIEFGRFAASNRSMRGDTRPVTFNF